MENIRAEFNPLMRGNGDITPRGIMLNSDRSPGASVTPSEREEEAED